MRTTKTLVSMLLWQQSPQSEMTVKCYSQRCWILILSSEKRVDQKLKEAVEDVNLRGEGQMEGQNLYLAKEILP